MRGLGTQAIPVFLDAIKDLNKTMEDNRDVVDGAKIGIAFLAEQLVGPLRLALAIARTEAEKFRAVLEAITGRSISFTGPPGGKETPPAEQVKDPFTKELEENVAARKRAQNVLNFEFAERQRQAASAIAQAQRDFEAGKKSRKELLDTTLDGIKKQINAEIEALKVERGIKLAELALAKDEAAKKAQLETGLFEIDKQIADKRSQLKQKEADERAKFRQQEIADELAHQDRLLARSKTLDQVRITGIEQQVALREKSAIDGDREIENIELAAIDREQNLLVKKLEIAGKDATKSGEITDRIKALDQERTATTQRHSRQRLEIAQREADITLQLIQISADAQIATVQALADARVITEEGAARKIAKLRIDALDAEIELAKARNADTRVLEAQRAVLVAETERDIDAAMQRDLDNRQRYADELERIDDRIRGIERDTAEEIIRLMRLHFASRKDIIKAERDLKLADEDERHRRATDAIRAQQRETDEQIKVLGKFIERLKPKTQEEIDERQRLIDKLEELRRKREALNEQESAENERSSTRKRRVTVEADLEIANPDESLRDVFDGLGESLTNLAGKFAEAIGAGQEFAAMSAQIAAQVGGALAGAFDQFANALGQTVQNWVLLGETGPAVMRKILAQALASLAAEAAVQAIKQLALGFATLFFNPAESAAHFTAAALWGSIAGVAAIAGRSVAGDLFKSKGGGSGDGSSSSERGSGKLDPTTLSRNQPQPPNERKIVVEFKVDSSQFGRAITAHVVKDYRQGGDIRQVIVEDGGPSQ